MNDMTLNYHLMHPGGDSSPGDPNAAFCLDGSALPTRRRLVGDSHRDLPAGEDVALRIFVDRYLIEVFANDPQALLAAHMDYVGKSTFAAFTVGATTTIKKLDMYKLRPTNQGFLGAQVNTIWEPDRQ